MKVGKKYRGSLDLSLRNYLKDRLSSPQIDRSLIFITHAACQPETVRLVKEQIMRDFPFEQVIITTAGCTISAHCGPNTLGVLFRHQNAATPSSDI
ncbi:hypothetical protein SDC9_175333 [bioreactor metagenome]|uniref:DegV domain-containing protein n=1 Tax=bioreactor metagenome TaxID=1076179 RepID=A0A645GPS0_9ZZZZ